MPFEVGRRKTRGRAPGTPNRASVDFREKVLRSGLSPIDYMCRVFRDENEPTSARLDAAARVANFIYPRMSTVDVNSANGQPIVVQILRFSDAPVEPKQLGQGGQMIEMTVADAATEAVEAVAEVVIEVTADGEEEC
jgi:hypothetical protein